MCIVMIITCPDCATRYNVGEAQFSPDGRRVRCQSCDSVWFQGPLEAEQVDATEQIDEVAQVDQSAQSARADENKPVDEGPSIDVETEAARLLSISKKATQQQKTRKLKVTGAIRGWAALAACVTIFLASSYIWRQAIVKTFPAAADIYARVYLPVNVRGLEFQNVVYENRFENGVPMLTIRGDLANVSADATIIPRIRFAVIDASDQELYHWTMKVRRKSLSVGGRTKFVTRLASPPPKAKRVQIRFAKIKERFAGIN